MKHEKLFFKVLHNASRFWTINFGSHSYRTFFKKIIDASWHIKDGICCTVPLLPQVGFQSCSPNPTKYDKKWSYRRIDFIPHVLLIRLVLEYVKWANFFIHSFQCQSKANFFICLDLLLSVEIQTLNGDTFKNSFLKRILAKLQYLHPTENGT